jgi:hypothetical protein
MENDAPATEIGRIRVRRALLSTGIRVPGLILLGALLLYVGGRNIVDGDDVAMWVSILVIYLVAAVVGLWLMLRGVEHAKD